MTEIAATKPSWGHRIHRVLIWVCGIALALTLSAYIVIKHSEFRQFQEDLTTYYGVKIGAPMAEVRYALNYPSGVEGDPIHDKTLPYGEWRTSYDLSAETGPTALPKNTKAEDYFVWEYTKDDHRTDVTFDKKTKGVTEVGCFTDASKAGQFCDLLFGITSSNPESYVIEQLGDPLRSSLSGSTKTMEYPALGLELVLQERKVYFVKKTGTASAGLGWFLSHRVW